MFSMEIIEFTPPLLFISKKIQVKRPELDSRGNAHIVIEIFKHGKLEIDLGRNFRDFAIFLI